MDTISNYQGVSLFVTHNMEEAYRVCRNLIVLNRGKVEATSSKEDLFSKPPTLAAAKLTGCKNFSEVLCINENEIEAINWGISLKTNMLMKKIPKFIGIDSGSIRLAKKEDQFNIFECFECYKSEAPNKVIIYLSIGNVPIDSDDFQLQWEMTKEEWNIISIQPQPWKVCIEPDNILMLEK
jgi:molybdate transport system ATP-binding protein